jgi:serine/threonine-protein phosphatase PPG1
MWSDPDVEKDGFSVSPRGAGYTFGKNIVHSFCHSNNINHVLRAHQLCMEGYQIIFDNMLSTCWSAPNYCYRCGNSASILEIGSTPSLTRFFNVFSAAPGDEKEKNIANVVKVTNEDIPTNTDFKGTENKYFL